MSLSDIEEAFRQFELKQAAQGSAANHRDPSPGTPKVEHNMDSMNCDRSDGSCWMSEKGMGTGETDERERWLW